MTTENLIRAPQAARSQEGRVFATEGVVLSPQIT